MRRDPRHGPLDQGDDRPRAGDLQPRQLGGLRHPGLRIETIRANFLIRKLGLKDGPDLRAGIDRAIETYGKSNRNKHRAVVYYLLTKHFGRGSVYA